MERTCYIYKIQNTVNGKCYVGSTLRLTERWKEHRHHLNSGSRNQKLINAWKKYGPSNFTFEVLSVCLSSQRDFQEAFWMTRLNSIYKGYNTKQITLEGSDYLVRESTKEKIGFRLSKKVLSEEVKLRLRSLNLGKKHSEETKRKISEACLGRKVSEEVKQRMSEANLGRKVSDETRRKLSEASKNRTEETRRKLSEANLGRKASEETRRRMSEAAKKRGISETTKTKLALARKIQRELQCSHQ